MTDRASLTLMAVVDAAIDATAAARGWILAVEGDDLVVVAAAGGDSPGSRIGARRAIAGTAGYVAASGQPAALQLSPDDDANAGAGGFDGIPTGILSVPCGEDNVTGVLELVNKSGGAERFSFDDVEVAALLARIAGAALAESGDAISSVPTPAELGVELERLAAVDAVRYAALASMLQAVLGQS